MNARTFLLALLLVAATGLAPALAGDAPPEAAEPAPCATPPACACRVALIPAHRAWIEREVTLPAVTQEVEVPVYETVKVPVYGTLTWEEKVLVDVPKYEKKSKQVKVKLWNPFRCWKEFDVDLWKRKKCEQVGTEKKEQVVTRTKQVVVDEREESRQVGTRKQVVVVTPARVETVRECVQLPDQWVTLGPEGTQPLPGTTSVLTEEAYKAVLKSAFE